MSHLLDDTLDLKYMKMKFNFLLFNLLLKRSKFMFKVCKRENWVCWRKKVVSEIASSEILNDVQSNFNPLKGF